MRWSTLLVVPVVALGLAVPAQADRTIQQECDAKPWPLPLPSTVGRTTDVFFFDMPMACLNIAAIYAPDGHDVSNDPANQAHNWRITGTSPAAGTLVTEKTPITVIAVPVN